MATQRYISTSFWDDEWVHKLDPSEKLLYLYFMTNPLTSIAGIYKISEERISFDTGFNISTIQNIMIKFEKSGKAYRYKEWVILPNWAKHQKVTERNNIKKGIDSILLSIPDDVYYFAVSKGYKYIYLNDLNKPLISPLKPLISPSNYSDIDSELDIDSDLNSDSDAIPQRPIPQKRLIPVNDGITRISKAQSSWNYQGLTPSKKLIFSGDDSAMMLDTIRAYTDIEIDEAIANYAKIRDSTDHDIGFEYGSFQGFMKSGVEKFVSDAEPFEKYRKEVAGKPEKRTDFTEYDKLMRV